jgi:hypothetical protein
MSSKCETFTAHGWMIQIHRHGDGWQRNVCLGSIPFGDLMLACQEGHPSQVYATAEEANKAAVAWAKENER